MTTLDDRPAVQQDDAEQLEALFAIPALDLGGGGGRATTTPEAEPEEAEEERDDEEESDEQARVVQHLDYDPTPAPLVSAALRRVIDDRLHREAMEIHRRTTFGGYGEHYCYCSPTRGQMLAPTPPTVQYTPTVATPDWTSVTVVSDTEGGWGYPPVWLCWTVGLAVLAAVALLLAILV